MKRSLLLTILLCSVALLSAQTSAEMKLLGERLSAFAYAQKVEQSDASSCKIWLSSGDSILLRKGPSKQECASIVVASDKIVVKHRGGFRYSIPRVADERGALTALYKATGGKKWSRNQSWGSSKPLNEWAGITCNDAGVVTQINLKENNLQGNLPDVFYAFSSLKRLNVSQNNLEGTLPRSLAWQKEGARIDIRKNRFSTTTLYVPRQRIAPVSRSLICYPQQEGYYDFRLFVDCDVDLNPVNGYHADKECRVYQTAKEGAGVNIYIIGDGYDRAEHAVGGTVDYWFERSAEAIFEIEPMSKLRNLFNVYFIYSHSPERGVGLFDNERKSSYGYWQQHPTERSNAKFSPSAVFDVWKESVQSIGKSDSLTLHFHMAVNSTNTGLYRGMMYSRKVKDGDGERSLRVSMLPTNPSTYNSLVWHEFTGHAFGDMRDEYPPRKEGAISLYKRSTISANLDLESDPKLVKWARFIEDERYAHEKLGVYKGGGNQRSNLYRATEWSIMRRGGNSKLRFNAPSRAEIYRKAMELAYPGWKFDYEEFVKFDLGSHPTK